MTTRRLNVNIDAAEYREFHLHAIKKDCSISDLVRVMIADEPMLDNLRVMITDLDAETLTKDLPIAPDTFYPSPSGGWVWEYRLPSGRAAEVHRTPSGVFLNY